MRRHLAAAVIAAATLLTVGPAAAAPPGTDGAFNFRLGGFFPTGHGDFWATNEAAFTLDHSDFNGLIGGVGYTASINNYFEFDVNADFYSATNRSEERCCWDLYGYPILHDTRLTEFPLSFGFRVLPAGRFARRGAEGKHYVRRPAFYIGGGIGMNYWQYEEQGDFLATDGYPTYARFVATGLAFQTHAMIGMEFPVAPEWNITFEVRQSWAEATPGGEFTYINDGSLDLGGTSIFVGGSLRF